MDDKIDQEEIIEFLDNCKLTQIAAGKTHYSMQRLKSGYRFSKHVNKIGSISINFNEDGTQDSKEYGFLSSKRSILSSELEKISSIVPKEDFLLEDAAREMVHVSKNLFKSCNTKLEQKITIK